VIRQYDLRGKATALGRDASQVAEISQRRWQCRRDDRSASFLATRRLLDIEKISHEPAGGPQVIACLTRP
jgi:hypothetical protein